MDSWQQIIAEQGLAARKESDVHPHVPEERAELFHSADGGSTEYEYLNLLHALVISAKPRLVLETGTFRGFGTLAIATALQFNGVGRLLSVDAGECSEAKALVEKYRLGGIQFVRSDSVKFCAEWPEEPFNLVFLDSDVSIRHRECDLLCRRGKLARQALVIVHDSSPLRVGMPYSWEMVAFLEKANSGLALNLSRGLRILQF